MSQLEVLTFPQIQLYWTKQTEPTLNACPGMARASRESIPVPCVHSTCVSASSESEGGGKRQAGLGMRQFVEEMNGEQQVLAF
jgi:hypothetical protein